MPIAFPQSRPQLNAIGTPESLSHPTHSETRHEMLNAIVRNDWTRFEHLAFGQENGIDIESERYSRGQNALHVAISAGSYTLATNLAWVCYNGDIDLIDKPDDLGDTPIVYAAGAALDHSELVDVLLSTGASVGLPCALKAAAKCGHREVTQRLIDSDIDVARVLAELIEDSGKQGEDIKAAKRLMNAAKLLISLGVDTTRALNYAAQQQWIDTCSILVLLGAKGSDALIVAIRQHVANYAAGTSHLNTLPPAVRNLLAVGSDVNAACITLANQTSSIANAQLLRLLLLFDRIGSEGKTRFDLPSDTLALLSLARHGNAMALCTMAELSESVGLACKILAECGHVEALSALINAGLVHTDDALLEAARQGDLFAIKTLLAVDANAALLLEKLYAECLDGGLAKLESIKVLMVAGADSSRLPEYVVRSLSRRKAEISTLSIQDKTAALLKSAIDLKLSDVMMLLESDIDIVDALKRLTSMKELESIRIVLNASTNATELLISRVRVNDTELVQELLCARDLSTDALERLIRSGDHATARKLLAMVPTAGRQALVFAINMNDTTFAEGLLTIDADGPEALLSLLKTNRKESAMRLVALGVDTHVALMHAIQGDSISAQGELLIIGAEPSKALMHALVRGDAPVAQQIVDQYGESAAQQALITLLDDENLSTDTGFTLLDRLLKLTFRKEPVLQSLLDEGKATQLNVLIKRVQTDELIMEFGRQGNRIDARQLFLAGADYIKPIKTLAENQEHHAVTLLGLALTGARDTMLATHNIPSSELKHSPNT